MAEIKVPDLGESISEGTLHKWLVKVGDTVGQGDLLAELETDKVNLEISAEESGVIESILRGEGENVAVGEVIAVIGSGAGASAPAPAPAAEATAAEKESASAAAPAAPAPVPAPAADSGAYHASPAARKLAREKGIDLNGVSARDPIGRIQHDDVQANAARPAAAPAAAPVAPVKP
ncbi:E3 binding domain-containing protein, partial [Bacillus cereus]|nr:E3 binding domain-containing protein [Bacillus cereus]